VENQNIHPSSHKILWILLMGHNAHFSGNQVTRLSA
jgi:hypothetical protein